MVLPRAPGVGPGACRSRGGGKGASCLLVISNVPKGNWSLDPCLENRDPSVLGSCLLLFSPSVKQQAPWRQALKSWAGVTEVWPCPVPADPCSGWAAASGSLRASEVERSGQLPARSQACPTHDWVALPKKMAPEIGAFSPWLGPLRIMSSQRDTGLRPLGPGKRARHPEVCGDTNEQDTPLATWPGRQMAVCWVVRVVVSCACWRAWGGGGWHTRRIIWGHLGAGFCLLNCLFPSPLWVFPSQHGRINPGAPLVAQLVKNPPAMQETLVWFLGREDPLEKG